MKTLVSNNTLTALNNRYLFLVTILCAFLEFYQYIINCLSKLYLLRLASYALNRMFKLLTEKLGG